MKKFVVMNGEGKFGVEAGKSGFGANSLSNLNWTFKINEATLFTTLSFKNVDGKEVIAKILAEETRVVTLLGEV